MESSREELYKDLEQYIREHWRPDLETAEHGDINFDEQEEESGHRGKETLPKGIQASSLSSISLDDLLGEVGKSFHEDLFERIKESQMTDVEVYKRANIDRKLFSKIRNNPAYHPRKSTVLALAIALKLDMKETEDFLARAEYAFSPGSKADVIIRYFIERKQYDIHTINIALYDYGLPILE